jgi:ribonuclease BN (tRNA processing enzyme)
MASSVLVQLPEVQFLFDIGRGVSNRLAEVGLKQDALEHIVLSHFHADHVGDLIPYLQAACWSRVDPRARTLNIYGPKGLKVQMMRLMSLFGPDEIVKPSFDIDLHEIREDTFDIGGFRLAFRDLPPAGNKGIRFAYKGLEIAITGDSSFHQQEVDFLKGTDIAIIDSGHLSDEELVQLAVQSSARRIYLSHLYRDLDVPELQSRAEKGGYAGELILAKELMEIDL